jgi:hypothetical protein
VLHLTLPITQAAQPRRIQVQIVGGSERQIEVEAEPAESTSASGESTQSDS